MSGVLKKAVRLLSCFTSEKAEYRLSELSVAASLPKSTTYRLASVLVDEGLLRQNSLSKQYMLGYKMLNFAQVIKDNDNIVSSVIPYMNKLREQTSETVSLIIEVDGYGICVERMESHKSVKFVTPVGSKVPLVVGGAARKILLAYLPEKRIKELLERDWDYRFIGNDEKLFKELKKIKQDECAYSCGEHSPGVSAIAVPLFNSMNKVQASLSIAGPSFRFSKENMEKTMSILQGCTSEIYI